jgi:hypothetical protein
LTIKLALGTILATVLGLDLASAGSAGGNRSAVIYSQGNPPAAPQLADLPLRQSVSQYGITWTFDQPAPVGRFVNGDFYIVGPVTVISIDPRPLVGPDVPEGELAEPEKKRVKNGKYVRNGSMLNPPARAQVAFDTGIHNYFKLELLAVPPLHMKPGDCLVSTISLKIAERDAFPYHGGDGCREHHDNSPVKTAAVLGCVAEPQPADAFRPSYGDRQQRIYLARNVRRNLLRRLPPLPILQTCRPGSAFSSVHGLTPVFLALNSRWRTCRITASGSGRPSRSQGCC